MPQYLYARCKGCGRSREQVGPLSWTRLCGDCACERMDANNRQISPQFYDDGPYRTHWRRRCVAAFGGVLLDDVDETG